jgi:1,4-dihydroxy-6-naphthoate synthase
MEIRIAHSPDSDDAFMFYALAKDKIQTGKFHFSHTLQDIETLNRKALHGEYEITAISFHAYVFIADKYVLLPSGASMGDRYGPMVVAKEPWDQEELRGKRIAIPGTLTTAYLTLRLFQPEFEAVVAPFDQIMGMVEAGLVDAGLLIHEGQLTYASHHLHKIVDLGEWWHQLTALPLPLGGNVVGEISGKKTSWRSRGSCGKASGTRWIIARRPCNTRCSLPAIWIPRLRTVLWGCMSMTERWITE